jgi:uncharacterized membrane protein YgdD (TMEM256/DUF423 family)
MNPAATVWAIVGAASGFVGVVMGAFGAHALAGRLEGKSLAVYQTAAQYQMYHALALVAVGLAVPAANGLPGWAFTVGTVLFSGSLYLLALTDVKWLGAITPLGGLGFLIGWASLGWALWRR